MKGVALFSVLAFAIIACSFKKKEAIQFSNSFEPIAVIELFTSQGCSSCPPADALLAKTIADAKNNNKKIFALSFHVDYWNRLGWTDPFSNAAYSARQNEYATAFKLDGPYTPQAIINGSKELIGSDASALSICLANALKTKAIASFTNLTAIYDDGKSIKVQYVVDRNFSGTTINIALISLSERTIVKRGENGGRTLTNENVVRQFITKNAAASGEVEFTNNNLAKENIAIVAFVQEKDKNIIGAAMAKLQ